MQDCDFNKNTKIMYGTSGIYQTYESYEDFENYEEEYSNFTSFTRKSYTFFKNGIEDLEYFNKIYKDIIYPKLLISKILFFKEINGEKRDGFIRNTKFNNYRKIRGNKLKDENILDLIKYIDEVFTLSSKNKYKVKIFHNKQDTVEANRISENIENSTIEECEWLPNGFLFIFNENVDNAIAFLRPDPKVHEEMVYMGENENIITAPFCLKVYNDKSGIFLDLKPDTNDESDYMTYSRIRTLNNKSADIESKINNYVRIERQRW